MNKSKHYAAIDLGSNSFHMIIAREEQGHLQVLDRLRDPVRLAMGLSKQGQIEPAAQKRALNALKKFEQRLREFDSAQVRCVGTNTLRMLSPKSNFLDRAQQCLGHPIEIIAGREEARLIYLGTTHSVAPVVGKQLVIDIGGGSTELIIGAAGAPQKLNSLKMGCVSFSERYFKQGAISVAKYQQAATKAARKLQPIAQIYKQAGWDSVLGCSGTIKAIQDMARDNKLCSGGINYAAMEQLRQLLLAGSNANQLEIDGLSEDRKPVIMGGFVILDALFQTLGLDFMQVSQSALREGLLYDTIGRKSHQDVRELTVKSMLRQYNVSQEQAQRVKTTASLLFAQAAVNWQLSSSDLQLLQWAAELSELGLSIAHSKYHRHSRYIVANADMAGFSWNEQNLIAALIHLQRSRFNMDTIFNLPPASQKKAIYLASLLRLAKIFNRSRQTYSDLEFSLSVSADSMELAIADSWLVNNQLTVADIESEIDEHRKQFSGIELTLMRT